MKNVILIINFSSKHLDKITNILQRFTDLQVNVMLWNEFDLSTCDTKILLGMILSGGPAHLYEPDCPCITDKIFELGIPILGICYGMQLIVKLNGGLVKPMINGGEFEECDITLLHQSNLFANLGNHIRVFMQHHDYVLNVPPHFKILAYTLNCIAALEYVNQTTNTFIYGVQFHPEIDDLSNGIGNIIFENFINTCKILKNERTIHNLI